MTEHAPLIKSIVKYLTLKGHFAWKNQTGAYRRFGAWIEYGYPGSGDIICCLKGGQFLCVECKKKKDRQRVAQIIFEGRLKLRGGIYIIADSFHNFKEKFKEIA